MLTKKEVKKERDAQSWHRYCESEAGREAAEWIRANRLLDGSASDKLYDENRGHYVSYDGEFRMVKPHSRPVIITGTDALKAWNKANEKDYDDYWKVKTPATVSQAAL